MTTQKQVPANIKDSGTVRIGGTSPSLPIRLAPSSIADNGKVRIGNASPNLPMPVAAARRGRRKVRGGVSQTL